MSDLTTAVPRRLTFSRGFSLVEMAVVLVIVALLIAGMMLPLSAQQDIRARQESEKTMAEIREALFGFAAGHAAGDSKPYLPCPDTDDDGLENRGGGACTAAEGRIPWATLGLGRNDAWNNRFRYAVTSAFSDSNNGFTLTSSGNITICADSTNCPATTIANSVPAIVLSHGPNGSGAYNMSGGTNPAPTDADEQENASGGNTNFVSKTPGSGFDDLVIWVPSSVLTNRMIAAGKLP